MCVCVVCPKKSCRYPRKQPGFRQVPWCWNPFLPLPKKRQRKGRGFARCTRIGRHSMHEESGVLLSAKGKSQARAQGSPVPDVNGSNSKLFMAGDGALYPHQAVKGLSFQPNQIF
eukprot:6462948-Amphidinium_carterae.3